MSVFDPYILETAAFLQRNRNRGVRSAEFLRRPQGDPVPEPSPGPTGPGLHPGIILRSDTFVELGNPLSGSCSVVLWTEDLSLIRDGTISLLGPDIPEAPGASLPFGQVLLIGGRELSDRDYEPLVEAQYVGDRIAGYMIRSAPDRIWSRVSREAVRQGFNFETLGGVLMGIYRAERPKTEAMEILFVTSSREEVRELQGIGAQVNKIGREMVRENWKLRGYDIDCRLDCNSCMDQSVCDSIREVLAARRAKA